MLNDQLNYWESYIYDKLYEYNAANNTNADLGLWYLEMFINEEYTTFALNFLNDKCDRIGSHIIKQSMNQYEMEFIESFDKELNKLYKTIN